MFVVVEGLLAGVMRESCRHGRPSLPSAHRLIPPADEGHLWPYLVSCVGASELIVPQFVPMLCCQLSATPVGSFIQTGLLTVPVQLQQLLLVIVDVEIGFVGSATNRCYDSLHLSCATRPSWSSSP